MQPSILLCPFYERRTKLTGTLTTRKTSSGKEYYYIYLRYKDSKTGKWKSKTVKTGLLVKNNKKKALDMIPFIMERYEYLETRVDSFIDPDISLCDYLDRWLKQVKSTIRPSTYDGYEIRTRRIKSFFENDDPMVREITPAMMDSFFKYCLLYGKNNQKTGEPEPLAVRSVRGYKSILHAAFDQARIDGLLKENPVNGVKVGKKGNRRYKEPYLFLEEAEVQNLMAFLSDNYPDLLEIAFFGVYYGLRRSEILGLKWDAVNEVGGYLTIRHTVVRVKGIYAEDNVKTLESNRTLDLFPTAVKCLHNIRSRQKQNRKFFGKEYLNKEGYVFCWEDGHAYDPNYISRHFRKAMQAYGRPEITLHKLRHTCATILIDKGWDIKKIQYWLGHEDIKTTLDIYAHYVRHKDNKAGNDMEEAAGMIHNLF